MLKNGILKIKETRSPLKIINEVLDMSIWLINTVH